MYLLYTDEVNMDPDSTDFFVYAGVAILDGHARHLSAEIDTLRNDYGYRPQDFLKFNVRERPDHVSPDDHREIKREVMEAAARHQVKLFASFISHHIARSPEDARRCEINRVCYHFDCYLRRIDDFGLVLIDTFQDALPILREKFAIGLRGLPYSDTYRLERVLGFHLASIGSSNFCSLVDIVLGALRYAVNSRLDRERLEVARTLLGQLVPLCIPDALTGKVDEICLFFSPKTIKVTRYLDEYRALHRFLAEGGLEAAQEPSAEDFI